mmetsp:Transcript_103490/g.178309  ORF Transcript_103490/g.178309 Transcript_103490/m.178309 type:complete len:413 (+) Transcript_103490:14515-15753(+)
MDPNIGCGPDTLHGFRHGLHPLRHFLCIGILQLVHERIARHLFKDGLAHLCEGGQQGGGFAPQLLSHRHQGCVQLPSAHYTLHRLRGKGFAGTEAAGAEAQVVGSWKPQSQPNRIGCQCGNREAGVHGAHPPVSHHKGPQRLGRQLSGTTNQDWGLALKEAVCQLAHGRRVGRLAACPGELHDDAWGVGWEGGQRGGRACLRGCGKVDGDDRGPVGTDVHRERRRHLLRLVHERCGGEVRQVSDQVVHQPHLQGLLHVHLRSNEHVPQHWNPALDAAPRDPPEEVHGGGWQGELEVSRCSNDVFRHAEHGDCGAPHISTRHHGCAVVFLQPREQRQQLLLCSAWRRPCVVKFTARLGSRFTHMDDDGRCVLNGATDLLEKHGGPFEALHVNLDVSTQFLDGDPGGVRPSDRP